MPCGATCGVERLRRWPPPNRPVDSLLSALPRRLGEHQPSRSAVTRGCARRCSSASFDVATALPPAQVRPLPASPSLEIVLPPLSPPQSQQTPSSRAENQHTTRTPPCLPHKRLGLRQPNRPARRGCGGRRRDGTPAAAMAAAASNASRKATDRQHLEASCPQLRPVLASRPGTTTWRVRAP